ncbi:MAG: transposase [Saprospiraceae bacterium]|nr:transposase [Candidatus Parvibacillus calidus]
MTRRIYLAIGATLPGDGHRKVMFDLLFESAHYTLLTLGRDPKWLGGQFTAHRIKEITDQTITFKYKDYADKSKVKEMTLSHAEFARRFEQHILPHRYVKIRHSGYLSHRGKTARLERLHQQMNLPPPMPKVSISTALRSMDKDRVDITICTGMQKR